MNVGGECIILIGGYRGGCVGVNGSFILVCRRCWRCSSYSRNIGDGFGPCIVTRLMCSRWCCIPLVLLDPCLAGTCRDAFIGFSLTVWFEIEGTVFVVLACANDILEFCCRGLW